VKSRVSVSAFMTKSRSRLEIWTRSRSRLLWQSLDLGLVSKFEPGLGLGSYGLDYITGNRPSAIANKLCIKSTHNE